MKKERVPKIRLSKETLTRLAHPLLGEANAGNRPVLGGTNYASCQDSVNVCCA